MNCKLTKLLIPFLLCISAWAQNPSEIVIGFTPSGDRELVKKAALELAQELQNELKLPVAVFLSKNYAGLTEALKNKKVDFAFVTSLGFVATEGQVPLKVLLKKVWSEPFYYSVLLTRKDSKIQNLKSLKGKRIAFVDEKSTSGYLYPMVELKKHGLDAKDFSIQFSGNHAVSVQLLQQSQVDAIAVFADDVKGDQSAWKKYVKDEKSKRAVRALWVSDPIPNDPFVVRQDFYDKNPKTAHSVMFALIEIAEKFSSKEALKEIISDKGFVPATSRQYDVVREMAKQLKIKVE
jgi:phosphonate transport system substrate-binding protein